MHRLLLIRMTTKRLSLEERLNIYLARKRALYTEV